MPVRHARPTMNRHCLRPLDDPAISVRPRAKGADPDELFASSRREPGMRTPVLYQRRGCAARAGQRRECRLGDADRSGKSRWPQRAVLGAGSGTARQYLTRRRQVTWSSRSISPPAVAAPCQPAVRSRGFVPPALGSSFEDNAS